MGGVPVRGCGIFSPQLRSDFESGECGGEPGRNDIWLNGDWIRETNCDENGSGGGGSNGDTEPDCWRGKDGFGGDFLG